MFYEKLHLMITILASIAVMLVCVYKGDTLFDMTPKLLLTIIVFYIIGRFVKYYLDKKVFVGNGGEGAEEQEEVSAEEE